MKANDDFNISAGLELKKLPIVTAAGEGAAAITGWKCVMWCDVVKWKPLRNISTATSVCLPPFHHIVLMSHSGAVLGGWP